MKRIFLALLAFLLLFLQPALVRAADFEHIQNYQTNITIHEDGSVGFIEDIHYVFDLPRHGIFRNIPVIKTNKDGKRYKMTLGDIQVTDGKGQALTVQQSEVGDDVVLKGGDPDTTITGAQRYIISYTVAGAMTYFSGHDELYWNTVGSLWPVPITETDTTISLPKSVNMADVHTACFTGKAGEKNTGCEVTTGNNQVTVRTTKVLYANEGVSVVVALPKGIVAVVEPVPVVLFFDTAAGKATIVLLFLFSLLWYICAPFFIIYRWWKAGRDPKPAMGETSAWFSPPTTKTRRPLTPAETGTLMDESADTRDIYATVIDLARRGYFNIIETKKGQFDFLKQKDWSGATDLQFFELELLDGIFDQNTRVKVKDLDVSLTFKEVKETIYESLVTDGFFPISPDKTRTTYEVLSGLAVMTFNMGLFLVCLFFGRHMPKKTLWGAQGAAVARSLKNFLISQDKKLAFQAKNQMMFEKLLPFAVAFGVEKIWAERFATMHLKQPEWYQSSTSGTFNSVVFAGFISNALSTSFASSVTQSSSSGFSSGFSGGGSSGGGGGGGGGGSW